MIDFRYHVVSLVAVLLALAVGVVLGAGPLQGELSDTIEGQVEDLRAERVALRAQVAHFQDLAGGKDEILETLTDRAVADVLVGTDVAVVEMPGADDELADGIAAVLATSGAGVLSRTAVQGVFDAPDDAETRDEILADIESELGADTDLPAVLAAAITGVGPEGAPVEAGALGTQLQQADVIEVTAEGAATGAVLPGAVDIGTPELVVVVTGGITAEDVPVGEDGAAAARVQTRVALVEVLADSQKPVLVVGSGTETWRDPPSLAVDPLVQAVRDRSDLAGAVSTVDNGESPAGQLSAAWTAAWTAVGETGHYGVAEAAEAVAPPPPPVLTPPVEEQLLPDSPEEGTPEGGSGGDGALRTGAPGDESAP